MSKSFRELLREGETLVGTMVTLPVAQVTETLALAGLDWLFIDGEHAPLAPGEVQMLIRGAGACPTLVRVGENQGPAIRAALDAGATGIIAPLVNSADEARRIVALCRYPPAGARSVGIGRAHGYGLRFGDYLARANEQTTVVIQVEHVDAVNDIEAIVWVEGVDAVFIGPYDLSASLGKPGQVTDPAVLSHIARVRDACRVAGRPLGIFGLTPDAVAPFQAQGFTLLAVGMDTVFLGRAAAAVRDAVRAGRRA